MKYQEVSKEELILALQDKDEIIKNILESSLAGYWDWYIQEEYEYMSPTFKSMFGYEDHEIENSPDAWQKIIHWQEKNFGTPGLPQNL